MVVNLAPKLCDGTLVINRRQLSRPEPEELEPGGYRRRTWRLGGSGKGLDPTPVAAELPAGLHLGLDSAAGLEKAHAGIFSRPSHFPGEIFYEQIFVANRRKIWRKVQVVKNYNKVNLKEEENHRNFLG